MDPPTIRRGGKNNSKTNNNNNGVSSGFLGRIHVGMRAWSTGYDVVFFRFLAFPKRRYDQSMPSFFIPQSVQF